MGIKNEFLPTRNNATPTMDIYAIQKRMHLCTEASASNYIVKKKCEKCKHFRTKDCKDRLMLEAAHALTLLLNERDKGEALLSEAEEKDGDDK